MKSNTYPRDVNMPDALCDPYHLAYDSPDAPESVQTFRLTRRKKKDTLSEDAHS